MTNPRILCRRPAFTGTRAPRPGPIAATLACLLLLAACSFGGDIDNPIFRRVQWFSYVQGEDIRAACTAGAPETYRFVYNADFAEQVRSYELTADASGGAYLVARAVPGGASLANFRPNDLHGWWRWHISETQIDEATFAELRARLAEDGFFERREGLLRLNSRDFYWLVTGCVDGHFETGAWLNGPVDVAALRFPAVLFEHDETGLPVAAPRWVAPGVRYDRSRHARDSDTIGPFWITVDDRPMPGS